MASLRIIAKKIPFVPSLYRKIRDKYFYLRLKLKTPEEIFTNTYKNNIWGAKDSVSGPGSDLNQTRNIIKELPLLFEEFSISKVLDIPCGDFHWMKQVDMTSIDYIGADIVYELIAKNASNYTKDNLHFQRLDLINGNLPKVDLVLCRDCFVHFSYDDIYRALRNIFNSQSLYILTTTFTERISNYNIATGQWRPLNLEKAPFNLPAPLRIISEGCTENAGAHTDKALGLWRVTDLKVGQ